MKNLLTPPHAAIVLLIAALWTGFESQAQPSCNASTPPVTWTNQSTSSLGFLSGSSFGGARQILGTFTVDVTVWTLAGADLVFNSGAELIVNAGCTLIVNNSLLTREQLVWEGIRVLPGGRVVVNNSTICGALDAVFCNAGFGTAPGSVEIRNSALIANQIGVRLQNFSAGAYPFEMTGTTIEGGSLSGASTTNSSRGIVAKNLETGSGVGITVGDATGPANAFIDLDVGIDAIASSAAVFNNTFDGMQDINGLGEGYAILANATNPGPHVLTVGGIGSEVNTMTDCLYGIAGRRQSEVEIRGNTYTAPFGPANTGIILRQISDDILINQNSISDFSSRGIFLDDNPGVGGGTCSAVVSVNTIANGATTSTGIFVDEHNGTGTVFDNTISDVLRGIVVQTTGMGSVINTTQNVIDYAFPGPPTTAAAIGIVYASVGDGTIEKNTVRGNCPFAGGFGPCTVDVAENRAIRGIQLAQTSSILVKSNLIDWAGAGLYLDGANFEGNALCNQFTDCLYGVVFDNTPLTGFGLATSMSSNTQVNASATAFAHANAENRWFSSISGFVPPRAVSTNGADAEEIEWWHRASPTEADMPLGTIFTVFPLGSPVPTEVVPQIGAPSDVCIDITPVPPGDSMTATSTMQSMIDSIAIGSSFITEDVFWFLQNASSDMAMRSTTRSLFSSTILDEVEQAMHFWVAGDLTSAQVALAGVGYSLAPEMEILKTLQARFRAEEQHYSDMLRTPSDRWQQFLYDTELEMLLSMSHSSSSEYGKAVFWSQSYLDTTIISNNWDNRIQDRLIDPATSQAWVFPNPTNERIHFVKPPESGLVSVMDISGQVVFSGEAPLPLNTIDCSQWVDGLYLIQWRDSDGLWMLDQFIVQHSRW